MAADPEMDPLQIRAGVVTPRSPWVSLRGWIRLSRDVGVKRREVPARPGRDPAAKRRDLEALGEVTKREIVLAKL